MLLGVGHHEVVGQHVLRRVPRANVLLLGRGHHARAGAAHEEKRSYRPRQRGAALEEKCSYRLRQRAEHHDGVVYD